MEKKEKKKVADTLLRISIEDLRSKGLLHPGANEAILEWPQKACRIKVVTNMEADGWGLMNLMYTIVENGQRYDVQVQIEPTACNYGGMRQWFRCCTCYSGTDPAILSSVLYFDGQFFCCRKCCNITYRSRLDRFFGVQLSCLDTFDSRYRVYRGQPTRRAKRLERKRKKESALAERLNRFNERQNKRIAKLKEEFEKTFGSISSKLSTAVNDSKTR